MSLTPAVKDRITPAGAGLRTAALVLAGCIAAMGLAEAGARAMTGVSRIEKRTRDELTAARQLRGAVAGGNTEILLIGNSLLLRGIDIGQLQDAMKPIRLQRLVVEQTKYLDWKYALLSLLRSGTRPDVIVLKLDAGDLLSNVFRGDYSANRLFAARDLLDLAHDADLPPTQAASLWFAHYSAFYGTRTEIRSFLLSYLMPGIAELRPSLARFQQQVITTEQIHEGVPPRLAILRAITDPYRIRLILLVPATQGNIDTNALVAAGARVGVEVLVPSHPGELSGSDFDPDGYHLNTVGARKYTAALGPMLRQAVDRREGAPRL